MLFNPQYFLLPYLPSSIRVFYANSKFMRNIVGGTSNLPRRYPTIIIDQANKKRILRVLVFIRHCELCFVSIKRRLIVTPCLGRHAEDKYGKISIL